MQRLPMTKSISPHPIRLLTLPPCLWTPQLVRKGHQNPLAWCLLSACSPFTSSFVGLFSFLFEFFSFARWYSFYFFAPHYCWAGLWPLLLLHVASLLLGCWRSRLECQCSRIRYCDLFQVRQNVRIPWFPISDALPTFQSLPPIKSKLLVEIVYNYLDPKI